MQKQNKILTLDPMLITIKIGSKCSNDDFGWKHDGMAW